MTIEEFSKDYKNKGGFEALNMMRNELRTTKYIAEHFGVTKDAVSLWMKQLFDIEYDPREMRKEWKIEKMLEYAKNNNLTEQQFREAYSYFSEYYYLIALQEGLTRGIFDQNKEAPNYEKIEEED